MSAKTGVIAVVGALAVVLYATFADLQILVLNPMAAVPTMSLTEIWTEVVRVKGDFDRTVTTTILAIGPVLAIGLLVVAFVWLRARPVAVAAGFLGLLMLGTPGYVVASFSPGMNLADTFGIDGADYSPWAAPLYATSALAAAGLVVLGARSGRGVFASWITSLALWIPAGAVVGAFVLVMGTPPLLALMCGIALAGTGTGLTALNGRHRRPSVAVSQRSGDVDGAHPEGADRRDRDGQ